MEECAVCLANLNDEHYCSLPCGHKFHVTCIISVTQYDLRCPMCRKNIPVAGNTKEESLPDIFSLENIYENYQRSRRNYLNRKRRFLNNNRSLGKINKEFISKKKEMKQCETDVNKLWSKKMKRIWNEDPDILLLRKKYNSQRRKCNRLEKKLNASLEDNIGSSPEFEENLEQWFENIL